MSGTCVVLMSAQGRSFTQAVARELAKLPRLVLICGRYEGVDERINELYCDMELSIGDYVLSGGELAAAVVVDTVMRLLPGVLMREASGEFAESFWRGRCRHQHRHGRRDSLAAWSGWPAGLPTLHTTCRVCRICARLRC